MQGPPPPRNQLPYSQKAIPLTYLQRICSNLPFYITAVPDWSACSTAASWELEGDRLQYLGGIRSPSEHIAVPCGSLPLAGQCQPKVHKVMLCSCLQIQNLIFDNHLSPKKVNASLALERRET